MFTNKTTSRVADICQPVG